MLDEPNTDSTQDEPTGVTAEASTPEGADAPADAAPAKKAAKRAPAKRAPRKTATKKAAAAAPAEPDPLDGVSAVDAPATEPASGATGEAGPPAQDAPPAKKTAARKAAAKKTAAKRAPAKRTAKKAAAEPDTADAPLLDGLEPAVPEPAAEVPAEPEPTEEELALALEAETAAQAAQAEVAAPPVAPVPLFQAPVVTTRRRGSRKAAAAPQAAPEPAPEPTAEVPAAADVDEPAAEVAAVEAPEQPARRSRSRSPRKSAAPAESDETLVELPADQGEESDQDDQTDETDETDDAEGADESGEGGTRRRRRRGGRRRRRSGSGSDENDAEDRSDDEGTGAAETAEAEATDGAESADSTGSADGAADGEEGGGTSRRRRRRRRGGEDGDEAESAPPARARRARNVEDEITSVTGSTRLEAKKQRRREGREAGRRRAPIISEAEFLARRESVERVMVIRQRADLTQIAVLEDKVLVEHYVARESQTSLIGNVYLGRVQNVLPSMEAAFIDIGKGRNAVLYAGEVNWEAFGARDGQRRIEAVLKPGQSVLVQVSKDPIGHKGARLTSQVSLPGRFLVYVPDGTTSGISRKLPDTERNRLKTLLKEIVPDSAGVIVRTAAEGASEDELTRDVERLTARWADIEAKVEGGSAPQLLYGEPDLTLKVVRDLFTEDFARLVVSGDDAWDTVAQYVDHVAPDLADRLERYDDADGQDAFAAYRIDEQIAKGLDRKVWLPSGGSLVIDRTEAMTVVDVNTGKFTGSGGNLEETVTKNNLEAAEEIVRQLRLRDIGGIIVVDFIDMVLESNRDLVLRRLVECLGRDRTRHQVAEVTSLGLVQMTRKRIGTGLLEAFSEPCEHCGGRGLVTHLEPVEQRRRGEDEPRRGSGSNGGSNGGSNDASSGSSGGGRRSRGGRGRGEDAPAAPATRVPTPKDLAAMARHEEAVAQEALDALEAGESVSVAEVVEAPEVAEPVVTTDAPAPVDEVEDATASTEVAEAADAPEAPEAAETPVPEQPLAEISPGEVPVRAAAPEPTPEPTPEPEPVAPAEPRIVTTVRRRGAHRAAGPPAGSAAAATLVVERPTEVAADQRDPGEHGAGDEAPDGTDDAAPHVPVKKKGSRKR